ncbi:MAG: hypothetical protein RIS91_266 [Bacteroidota bacterium]|jgi:hypothetical protein
MTHKIDIPDIGKPMLKIGYDAFYSNFEIEDFEFISDFKTDLDIEYSNFIKARPVGRGGNAYELVVEFFLKVDLKTYLTIIGCYVANKGKDKIVDAIIDKYLFKPFFNFFQSFIRKQGSVEIYEFKIELFDSQIKIIKVAGISIPEIFDKIIEHIYLHFNNIIVEEEFPSEFVIPVFCDRLNNMDVYRPPLGLNETNFNITQSDYFKLWNLNYEFVQGFKIYDLINREFVIDPIYMNEQEFISEKYKY